MSKRLLVGLLGVALAAASMFPVTRSDAAHAPQPKTVFTNQSQNQPPKLPNFDIRLAGRGEFTDADLNSTADSERAAKSGNAARQARASAVDNFRAKLRPEKAKNLRAQVNEAGALKNIFVDGASLSEPESDVPDNSRTQIPQTAG